MVGGSCKKISTSTLSSSVIESIFVPLKRMSVLNALVTKLSKSYGVVSLLWEVSEIDLSTSSSSVSSSSLLLSYLPYSKYESILF